MWINGLLGSEAPNVQVVFFIESECNVSIWQREFLWHDNILLEMSNFQVLNSRVYGKT